MSDDNIQNNNYCESLLKTFIQTLTLIPVLLFIAVFLLYQIDYPIVKRFLSFSP